MASNEERCQDSPSEKLIPSNNSEYLPLLSLSGIQDKEMDKKESSKETYPSLQGQYLGYLTETILPFCENKFVLVHSQSADTVEIAELTDNKVKKQVSRDKVSLLDETTLVSNSKSPFSAESFISKLIETNNSQLFDIALQQGIRDKAK